MESESQASCSVAFLKALLPFLFGTNCLGCCTQTPFLPKVRSPVTWQEEDQLFPGCTKPPSPERCLSPVVGEGSPPRSFSHLWLSGTQGGKQPASPGLRLVSTGLTHRGARQQPFTPPGTVHGDQLAPRRKENKSRACSDGSAISRPRGPGAIVLWLCPFHRPVHAAPISPRPGQACV